MSRVEVQTIKTDGHTILLGRHSLAHLAELLATRDFAASKIFILVDENTLKHCLPLLLSKVAALREAEVLEIPAGEESKSLEIAQQLWAALSDMAADRDSLLINLGGGVVSDLGGFLAGNFKRGLRFINCPTSLLAQVDASVGGKVGINFNGIKNELGLFKNPELVFVDPEFLGTLPQREMRCGLAEMLKHGLVCDAAYWHELQSLSFYEPDELDKAINRSVQIKAEIVSSDPFESGRRKVLNFGHTVGHALEAYAMEGDMQELNHGEAVAVGMVCEAFISHRAGFLNESEIQEISSTLFENFPKIIIPDMAHHRILSLMRHDKKNAGGKLRFSLLEGIGDSCYDQEVPAENVIDALNFYKRWVSPVS